MGGRVPNLSAADGATERRRFRRARKHERSLCMCIIPPGASEAVHLPQPPLALARYGLRNEQHSPLLRRCGVAAAASMPSDRSSALLVARFDPGSSEGSAHGDFSTDFSKFVCAT